MTTTDPKLIERIAQVICRGGGYGQCVGFCHAQRCLSAIDLYGQTATAILPILAAAINEAVQKERAGIVAWLRADARDYGYPESAIRIELADAIEAHKESGHG